MLLSDLLLKYAASRIKFSGRSEGEYRTTIANLSRWMGREALLSDLTDETLAGFLRSRVRERSAPTARKDRQQLLSLWRWAWRKSITETQPRDIPDVPVPRKRVRAWHPSEVATILQACAMTPAWNGWTANEWVALVLVCYDSGERIGALLRCPLSGFNAASKTLLIPANVRKCGAADQLASLHTDTVAAIERTIREPRELLFEFPGCYLTLLRRFKAILVAAGIDVSGRKVWHDLRKSSFTLTWAALGKEAARQQCGHSQDLSAFYLDAALLAEFSPQQRVADVIARPAAVAERLVG